MRLQFKLDKIKIDPACHVQLARHAEQFQGRNNIYGQLYGALLEDTAQITSILPLPEGQKTTKEELETMEKRNDDLLNDFNLDVDKIGWYLICYTHNFWDNLETMRYYEVLIPLSRTTSIPASSQSTTTRQESKAATLTKHSDSRTNSPLKRISAGQISRTPTLRKITLWNRSQCKSKKNEFFELMMLWNKDSFLKTFEQNKRETSPYDNIKKNIEQYITAFDVREQIQKQFNDNHRKLSDISNKQEEKTVPFEDYCQFLGQAFKLDNYETYLKSYLKDNKQYEKLFQIQHE